MIVCSCNVLSDGEVRDAARTAARRSTSHVYGCLGCSAQCGRCARTIRKIIDEALGGAKLGCPVGCACAMHAGHSDAHAVEGEGAHKHCEVEPEAPRLQKPAA
jgi:bacterioferritin-associated ferredoxin